MGKRQRASSVGVEEARKQLPTLLERAHRGETTVITKHGKPHAAVVPVEKAHVQPPSLPLTSLRGSGKGLWGEIGPYLDALRQEWT
jgi:prevent-host-death family protein